MPMPSAPTIGDLLLIGPRLYDRSRSQFALARSLIGMLPCIGGGTERLSDAPEAPVVDERVDVLTVLAPADEPSVPTEVPRSPAAGDADVATGDTVPAQAELAIPDYDSLAASQVVPKLATLDDDELGDVASYEAAHRARRTILNRVAQLRKD